jgi:DeoR family transcriptional regulator, myo-inositol catabolism operon repressor
MLDKLEQVQEYIYLNRKVEIKNLKKFFNLSDSTLRRYLNKLEAKKVIIKEYGYVLANTRDSLLNIKSRIDFLHDVKTKIAAKAASLIKDNQVIFVDSGSTHMDLPRFLSKIKNLTIVTNNLLFAIKAIDQDIPANIVLIAGNINKNTISVSGDVSLTSLDNYFFDISFITTSGVSIENGCSNRTSPEAEIKRKIIARSKVKVLLADDSKFNQNFPFSFAKLDEFDYIFTNKPLANNYLKVLPPRLKIIHD